jgi:hypothetical protein
MLWVSWVKASAVAMFRRTVSGISTVTGPHTRCCVSVDMWSGFAANQPVHLPAAAHLCDQVSVAKSFVVELWPDVYTGSAAGGFTCSCCRASVLLLLGQQTSPL